MPSPADKQAEAIADVERIAQAIYDEQHGIGSWGHVPEGDRHRHRRVVECMLHRDVIRVGTRPNIERPLEGQTTIDDA